MRETRGLLGTHLLQGGRQPTCHPDWTRPLIHPIHPRPAHAESGPSAAVAAPAKGAGDGPAVGGGDPGCRGPGDVISDAMTRAFTAVGRVAGGKPLLVMLVCLVVAAAFGSGLSQLTQESRSNELWIPAGSEAQKDFEFVMEYFDRTIRGSALILKARDGSSVLTPEAVQLMGVLDAEMRTLTATAVALDGEEVTVTNDNLCIKTGPICYRQSLFEVLYAAKLNPLEPIPEATLLAVANGSQFPTPAGVPLRPETFFGDVRRDDSGKVTGVGTLRINAIMKYERSVRNGQEVDPEGAAWEKVWLDWVFKKDAELRESDSPYVLTYFAQRSFEDEFGSRIQADVQLIFIAVAVIFVYAFMGLSDWTRGCIGTRAFLTVMVLVTIGMSIASAFGLASYMGYFYSPLMSIFPILLLGIGVDDAFMITNAFDVQSAANPGASVRDRMSKALGAAGSSVSVTSLTDFGAFLIGTNTSLPALRNFSIYAAIGIVFTWLFSVTFLSSAVSIDSKKREAARLDCLPCISSAAAAPAACCKPLPCGKSPRWMSVPMESLGKGMATAVGKIVVLVVFAAISAVGIIGAARVDIQSDIMDFVPRDSYVHDFVVDRNNYYPIGEDVGVYVKPGLPYDNQDVQLAMLLVADGFTKNPNVEPGSFVGWFPGFLLVAESKYCDPTEQAVDPSTGQPVTVTVPLPTGGTVTVPVMWPQVPNPFALGPDGKPSGKTFQQSCDDLRYESPLDLTAPDLKNVNWTPDGFYTKVYKFLRDPEYTPFLGPLLNSFVTWNQPGDAAMGVAADPEKGIFSSTALFGKLKFTLDSDEQIKQMDETRKALYDLLEGAKKGFGKVAFVFSPAFPNYEQYKSVRSEFRTNIGLALLMVIVIVFVLIGNPLAALVTSGVVVLNVVEIVGLLHFWDIQIDTVVVMLLVVSLGLSVDYSVHIAHAYLEEHGSANERLVSAMRNVGAAVFNGGLSTWLAVLVMAGSQSYIFIVFFRSLFLCTTLGIANGMLLLPVLLNLVNPRAIRHKASNAVGVAEAGRGG